MQKSELLLNELASSFLQEDEHLQKDAELFIMDVVSRVVEAAIIKKKSGHYRYSSGMEVTPENLVKRSINNLGMLSNNWKPYKFGLIDIDESNIKKQKSVVSNQIKLMLRSSIAGDDLERLSSDIADVLTSSWNLSVK